MTQANDNTHPAHDVRLLTYYYDMALQPLHFKAYAARLDGRNPAAVDLAETLIGKARDYDIRQSCALVATAFNGVVARDPLDPPDYTHPSIAGQDWTDDPHQPLLWDEKWNKGRRATNIAVSYGLDGDGLPVNPYLNYGVRGRGTIGRFGPNHAVDDGVLSIRPNARGEPTLHALGIIRKDNGLPALCGGFTEFHSPYRYTQRDVVDTQTQEFFEELVSGSVALLPRYAEGLDDTIGKALQHRARQQASPLTERQQETVRQQVITHRKLEQVTHEDPLFLENVRSLFETAQDCYKGPVLDSSRNTNSAWMETRLSWFMLDDATWNSVKGDDKFGYDFKAGDDAQQVLWHEITPELVEHATGSHGAFFTYLLSSYLLTAQETDPVVQDNVREQAGRLVAYYDRKATAPAPV